MNKALKVFISSAVVLLLATSAAKFVSSFGHARILDRNDPIFQVSFRVLFLIVASLELGVSLFCILSKSILQRIAMVAWIATMFLAYRMGMILVGYNRPCPCLGNLTDSLHLSPQTATLATTTILIYLTIGSYLGLVLIGWQMIKNSR
jgi:hypothetical protein